MDKVITFAGDELEGLEALLSTLQYRIQTGQAFMLSMMIDDEGFKIKQNQETWSPGMGTVTQPFFGVVQEEEETWVDGHGRSTAPPESISG